MSSENLARTRKLSRSYLEKFYSINELAAQYFANNLSSAAGNEFKLYLENRQFNASTIAEWKLGCVNKNQKGLIEFLGKNNISIEDMIKAGLALDRSDENTNQDIIGVKASSSKFFDMGKK